MTQLSSLLPAPELTLPKKALTEAVIQLAISKLNCLRKGLIITRKEKFISYKCDRGLFFFKLVGSFCFILTYDGLRFTYFRIA